MAKHTFQQLAETYQGFLVPTYQLIINGGTKLDQSKTPVISMIEVELTAGYEASACSLRIFQGVDLDAKRKTYQVDPFIRDNFQLGHTIEVLLGYLKERETVFKGIITGVQLEFTAGDGFQLQVECMDVKRLMMNNYHSCQPRKDLMKYGDAVQEVLKKYAKNIGKQNIAATPERALAIQQHNQSDYEFVVSLAKKINYAFYLVNGDVFFEEFGKDTSPLLELHANNLQSFFREITLANQLTELTVRNNDELNPQKPFEYTAKDVKAIGKGNRGAKDLAGAANQNAGKTIIDPTVSSANEAKARAEAELARHAWKFAQGTFKTVGIPIVVPGRLLTIKGFGSDYDNDYYVKKVLHRYSANGYRTSGELGVNKI